MDTVEPLEQENVVDVADQSVSSVEAHDPYAALRFRDFRLLVVGRFIASLGEQMISVAIGWELYERTNSELALGLVGLVQIIPVIGLALFAGHAADRFPRKQIVLITQLVVAASSLGLALLSHSQGSLALIYACLFVIGVGRAFSKPASSAFLSQTVPTNVFASAAMWSSSAWQLAAVIGPAFGGLMIAVFQSAAPVFLVDAIACFIFVALIVPIQAKQPARVREATTVKALAAGIHYVWNDKVILAAITLDMFAVLLGGATALLPVYARDILNVGPTGLGWLAAAPSIGAVLMALIIAHRPPFKHAGVTLLWAVAGFGAATIVFGVSQSFILSLLMLGALGALDNISVVIRSTLMLTRTPDEMRGRISAVNGVFVGASNELGRFESGVAANFFGPVIAVVAGGVGAILVVAMVAGLWPEMRKLGGLNE